MNKKLDKGECELGIYIHIPFCVKKCDYCDFLSYPVSEEVKRQYLYAMVKEIKALGMKYSGFGVKTVFIGGGTPSILESELLHLMLGALRENFFIEEGAEFSMECNPGTLDLSKIKVIKQYGVNRISLGLQSANDSELKKLGRIHTFEDFLTTYELLRNEGIKNINIDLMSALPFQTPSVWENTLNKVISLQPEHISAYSLIVEKGTRLYEKIGEELKRGVRSLPEEETEREMYYRTKELLEDSGYLQYEISNFAIQGFECNHNISYWVRKNYLGIGLSAASLMDNIRYHNTNDLSSYLKNSCLPNKIQEELHSLSGNEQMQEFMFLGLRMIKGISMKDFVEIFHKDYMDVYGDVTGELVEKGLVFVEEGHVRLTKKGIDLSNYVMAQFLIS